jgi:hypothetical protein
MNNSADLSQFDHHLHPDLRSAAAFVEGFTGSEPLLAALAACQVNVAVLRTAGNALEMALGPRSAPDDVRFCCSVLAAVRVYARCVQGAVEQTLEQTDYLLRAGDPEYRCYWWNEEWDSPCRALWVGLQQFAASIDDAEKTCPLLALLRLGPGFGSVLFRDGVGQWRWLAHGAGIAFSTPLSVFQEATATQGRGLADAPAFANEAGTEDALVIRSQADRLRAQPGMDEALLIDEVPDAFPYLYTLLQATNFIGLGRDILRQFTLAGVRGRNSETTPPRLVQPVEEDGHLPNGSSQWGRLPTLLPKHFKGKERRLMELLMGSNGEASEKQLLKSLYAGNSAKNEALKKLKDRCNVKLAHLDLGFDVGVFGGDYRLRPVKE